MTRRLVLCACTWLALGALPALSAEPSTRPVITIVYPREGQVLPLLDSEFVIGQALGATRLEINGVKTELFDSGAFLGWIPVKPGRFVIRVEAANARGKAMAERVLEIGQPPRTAPPESLKIYPERQMPAEDVWLWPGDLLEVQCRTSSRAELSFSIPGVADNLPMIELPAQHPWLYTGNAFRANNRPDSTYLRGVYYGSYRVSAGERVDSLPIVFHARNRIALYDKSKARALYASDSVRYSVDSSFADLFTTDSSTGRVTVLDDRFPRLARVDDSAIVTRVGPGQGYFWPYMPRGTQFEVTGRQGPWVRLKLSPYQETWAHDSSLVLGPPGFPLPKGTVSSTRIDGTGRTTQVKLFLTEQLPYRITESLDPLALTITVYGVTSNIDWIRYDFDDVLVRYAEWDQIQPGVLEYTVYLQADQLWGYDSWYDGSTLVVAIKKPPTEAVGLRGFTIVVDPGHSSDDGALGPTGVKEKDANLWISKRLREALHKRGAEVVLTRGGSEHLPLYERPAIAKQEKADLFISIHNNALPDGVNPWQDHGVSTYYYYPSSMALAESVQASLLASLDLPNFGLYRGNFAVIRPTQYPAILVECAFMMIPQQEAALKTEAFQTRVAEAIAEGVERWVKGVLPDQTYLGASKARKREP
jgi:N-acetylmuramoyl-L-alanine amidase